MTKRLSMDLRRRVMPALVGGLGDSKAAGKGRASASSAIGWTAPDWGYSIPSGLAVADALSRVRPGRR